MKVLCRKNDGDTSMKKAVKITIITVAYNVIHTIEQTIQSVVQQSYENIEYIIIDGESKDGTLDIIKKYEHKLAYWVSEPDTGIYDAMNKGVNQATGDYILFLGADDWLLDKDIIARIIPVLPSADVIVGTVLSVHEELGVERREKNVFSLEDIYAGYHPPHQGMFVRTSIMKAYKFNCKYRIVADYDFFLKCYFDRRITIRSIDQVVSYYSLSGVSNNNKGLVIKEDCCAMLENGISKNHVEVYKERRLLEHDKIKKYIKKCFSVLGILKKILLKKGWTQHACSWRVCRVCKK